ncbi:MAG: chemotaxis protein MotA [Zetaproteobacteria bacterium CG12_big_fil_rev_8_21_14_0_65_54_13]|nr:MAG: chemotaxis protein MotA [Zetaproteobacteria bacterium CG12_big_fil_rev_8_21_14_0_65_54_13]PIX54419.1 MAG: chemotaxis protein MotA [Zetaproteobacteria bacterium CG_4_10_14_3_um_filter_54_28]PJA28819.1 MAG: chemotaxis protein MotA [Zetaproteobacteria bacterium CG_4_9_14_3_um_filter_54_145]
MDLSTIAGILVGIGLIILSVFLSAVEPDVYINLPGLLIVIGGTFAATLVSFPAQELGKVWRVLGNVFRNNEYSISDDISEIANAARLRRHGDLARIEDQLSRIGNPFLRTAIQLVIDNTPTEEIVNILQWRIKRLREQERAEAHVFHVMSVYAPAFGMFGTLVGMVNMLFGISGPDMLNIGHNMAVALMTTLYGVILSNLIFKPIAIKLERRTEKRAMIMRMIVEGTIMLAGNRSPVFIRETLSSFSAHHDDELRSTGSSSGGKASTTQRSSMDDDF